MIDWARVGDLRAEIGGEDFAEVIELFLEEADEVVARLSGPSELGELGKLLHFLKGSALNLGFSELAALCQDGERMAETGAAAKVDPGRVATVYRGSKQEFLAGLRALSVT